MQDQSERQYEDRLQAGCAIWFHNTYPSLRGLLCYNLNNSANAIQGNKNKAMGLQPGRSDLVLYYHQRAYMIEMKAIGGKQSKTRVNKDGTKVMGQEEWQALVEAQGFDYYIIRTLEEFKKLINRLLTIDNTLNNPRYSHENQ